MDSFSFPIKFNRDGLKRLTSGSEEYYRQILSIAILTEKGENPLSPDFGVSDPSFTSVDAAQFLSTAARFVPEVNVDSINVSDDVTGRVKIEFSFSLKG